jgi:Tfp pilus assembly protein PilN
MPLRVNSRTPTASRRAIILERENAALRRELAETKHALMRRQNAYSKLSHFHERLTADKGLMPTKAFTRIVDDVCASVGWRRL